MKRILLVGLSFAIVAILAACNSETTVTEYAADGKTITKVTTVTKESPLKDKSVSTGGSFSAIKIESTGSATSGTPTANIAIGGGCAGIASSPKDDDRPIMGMSWSCGILSSLTSASASSGEIRYIGLKNESAADTAARLKAMKDAANVSDSTQPDSSSENIK